MNSSPFYSDLEARMQAALKIGLEDFRESKYFGYCSEYHDFLWADDRYTYTHRKRLPHAPYEFAARYVGIPLLNLLLDLGILTNTWFPGYYDIEDEFANGRQPPKHPSGRVSQMVLFYNTPAGLEKLCKIEITFQILHTDLDGDFGFKEPIISVTETYSAEPEKYVDLSRANQAAPDYHLLGESWVI